VVKRNITAVINAKMAFWNTKYFFKTKQFTHSIGKIFAYLFTAMDCDVTVMSLLCHICVLFIFKKTAFNNFIVVRRLIWGE